MTLRIFLTLAIVVVLTIVGDYFIKIASQRENSVKSFELLFGMVFYSLSAIGWMFLMRDHSLSVISVFYSTATILILSGLGYFVFKENFGVREGIGVTLAIMSVVVMSYDG